MMEYIIMVNGDPLCYCKDKKKAHVVAQCIYHMRGFFSKDFEEVEVTVTRAERMKNER